MSSFGQSSSVRTAVVTGASRGLGLALTKSLVTDGWNVIVDARTGDDLAQAVSDIGGPGLVLAIPGDVTDPKHRRRLFEAASEQGGFKLLVNNASYLGPSPQPSFRDYPLEALREVFEVNAVAPLALIQELLPLLPSEGAVIINVSSDAGVEGYEGWGGYGSSKAALEQLSRVLAAEHPGIRVYWVDPGDMNTVMHQEAYPGEDISDRPFPEESVPGFLELIKGERPSGRYQARSMGNA